MCGPNVRMEDIVYEAMREEPGFDLLPLDRQGEIAAECAAMLVNAMEEVDLQVRDDEDADRTTDWVIKKAREYVRNELEAWK